MLIKMYKNKKDVDIHVDKLVSKLSLKDFKTRAYSVARLYFEVGDYGSCQKYVEQYLTFKPNNAAGHKLLGQTFQKMGFKDKALEQFKISLDLDPTLTSIVVDICELLIEDDITDVGRAKYWCEKAEASFPKHPVTFQLREKLLAVADPDPEAIIKLLISELQARPKDVLLHCRLIKHYLNSNKLKEAYEHSSEIELDKPPFLNNFVWYETLIEVLNRNSTIQNDWLYHLLLLTVKERLCMLSLTETPQGLSKSVIESSELLYDYDQSIGRVSIDGPTPGHAEFHAGLLNHHRGQLAFLSATFILKKAKKDQLNWHEATKFASFLMLCSWQTVPMDPNVNWLKGAPEKQKAAVLRWYVEGAYRCSQAGYFALINNQDKSQLFINQISQFTSEKSWKDKLYDIIFASGENRSRANSYITSNLFNAPALRLPRKVEIQAYDLEAQKQYPNSLHHFVWILSNYNNLADFKCTLFDMLTPSMTTCGPETLNKLDILAFLYSATLTAKKQKDKFSSITVDVPCILPANITNLLCTLPQIKWWDCAYKISQNEVGCEYTDIRSTLSRGIEVVRCIDNHGLDPELLCILGRIFNKLSTVESIENKDTFESRAKLYYSSAIPLLEKLKSKSVIKLPSKRLFDYTHSELDTKGLNSLLEESKLFIALIHYNECEYVPVIELLSCVKTADSYYYLSESYRKLAEEEKCSSKISENNSKFVALLGKAKHYAFKSLEILKEKDSYKSKPLYHSVQESIDNIESCLSKIDTNISMSIINDGEGRFSSDENVSEYDNVAIVTKSIPHFSRNLSSTPKQPLKLLPNMNSTNYRTALDSNVFDNTHVDQQLLDRIEKQIKHLQKRDASIEDFMEQTKNWFDENRKLGNQIINTIHSNIENTTEQFKLLKISVEEVKEQAAEWRNEYKDVSKLVKQIAELKKEVNKLKKSSSEQAIDDTDLYNLDDYRTNENTPTYGTQIPFATPQVMPPFTQRLVPPFPVPPNPYHLYGQNLYNLYNQYSQLTQNSSVPGAPTMFEPNRPTVQYPGVYQTPDQMYLDVAHLIQPTIPSVPSAVPNVPAVSSVSTAVSVSPSVNPTNKTTSHSSEVKQSSRSLPVNVVITSSDPLPTCTTAPVPVLSVTIPQKHIKGSPHNYQISMPFITEAKTAPPVFNFPTTSVSVTNVTSASSSILSNWGKFNSPTINQNTTTNLFGANDSFKNIVDGVYTSSSPNTSLNKSRTLSEKSNTSIDNYDPCPDFKPIIPLPAEVKVTTGEENETVIFCARAKLFRFIDSQWKERGIGEMKLLRHNSTGKVRVLMRREQVHKICANHIIVPEMEIKPMKNETKAYFWVANDFAEETVILEKFSIRFKSADIAKNFFDTFENARIASATDNEKKINEDLKIAPVANISNKTTESLAKSGQTSKTVIGGFTFNSTPSFKTVVETSKTETKSIEPATTKVNVFSNLSFKTSTSSPFSNVFSTSTIQNSNVSGSDEKSSKLNNSDTVEEFEPTVEFKPVVPLPALIDQKTGEENEVVLFEYRAKLLRFDSSSKEWKERGLGNIKLLANKENKQKVRLLMRREQIMKVCCNHTVTKDMSFQKMPNMDKAVTWCAKDFSEGELIPETFCLRFKTVQVCNDFIEAVKSAQSYLGDEIKSTKEDTSNTQQNSQLGFGDQFKQKPGSWECSACYTNNLDNFAKCACCETPKPEEPKQNSNVVWGDRFKPKPGTWECKQCLIRNQPENGTCNACNSPKDPESVKTGAKIFNENLPKFNFGISTQSTVTKEPVINPPISTGWGDKFKPKEGSWECKQCFVRNEKTVDNCSACNNPQDPQKNSNKEAKSIFGNTSTPKFTFGIPSKPTIEQNNAPAPAIFNTNSSQTFKFGITPSNDSTVKAFGEKTSNNSSSDPIKPICDNDTVVNLSIKKNENENASKPALLPTPTANITFGCKQGGTFDFAFKPKSPVKGKSPIKSPKCDKGEESGDDEYVSEDEGAHIHFSPVIPMPDKIQVVTGEENEEEIYAHRAKLFIFSVGEWKERGIGIVKILKHKDTGKLRVLMRREQVHKICLNHILSKDLIYKPKDEKTWIFAANDYSDGEIQLQQFCLRFQNKNVAEHFKEVVDKAIKEKYGSDTINDKKDQELDDVIFVSEIHASPEEKQRAKELMLPENFYTYKNKNPCEGCRGCDSGEKSKSEPLKSQINIEKNGAIITTPNKEVVSNFRLNSSIYGTPSSVDKTVDSIFQTPLSSKGSNIESSPQSSPNQTLTGNKINFSIPFNSQSQSDSNSTEKPATKPVSFVSSGFMQTPTSGTKSSILAAPKLSTSNPKGDQETETKIFGLNEPKNVFNTAETKNLFGFSGSGNLFGSQSTQPSIFSNSSGISTNTSIFQSAPNKTNNPDIKSVFSVDGSKPVNLFTSSTKGSSLFGPTPDKTNDTKPTGGIFNQTGTFSFGNLTQNIQDAKKGEPFEKLSVSQNLFNVTEKVGEVAKDTPTFASLLTKSANKPDEKPQAKDEILKIPETLSFGALSSSTTAFAIQKKDGFKWEGAGQQLFASSSTKESGEGNDAAERSGADAADDEYDPHYEPIVPLPDKIVVTTGEEDEEKLFGERCKLYRFDDKTKEWKERGVGEMKILYHPERKTYRLLLRREQVHKAVLNMLIFMDLELLPMKNSDTSWTWAGRNYADSAGEQETLAVRFKSVALATQFQEKVLECVRKLQVAEAEAIRKDKEAKESNIPSIAPLRLPKHLEDSARADKVTQNESLESDSQQNGVSQNSDTSGTLKQVHFEEEQDNEDDYENDYDEHGGDSEEYYNEEEEESAVYYACDGEVTIEEQGARSRTPAARVEVLFDTDVCSPKILVTDAHTGEILADMLIHTDTEFQIIGDTCSWSGVDYTRNVPADKKVTVHFADSDTTMEFYDSCETSKASTYVSNDPES